MKILTREKNLGLHVLCLLP